MQARAWPPRFLQGRNLLGEEIAHKIHWIPERPAAMMRLSLEPFAMTGRRERKIASRSWELELKMSQEKRLPGGGGVRFKTGRI